MTPIREALKQLEKDNLVYQIPNKGAEVVRIFIEDVIEIYDIRLALESLSIQLISKKMDKDFLKLLRMFEIESKKFLLKKGLCSYQKYNKSFHELIVSKTENKRLIYMMNLIINHMLIIDRKNISLQTFEKNKEHTNSHIQIIHALEMSDFKLAEKLLKEHIINTKEEVLENFKGYKQIN